MVSSLNLHLTGVFRSAGGERTGGQILVHATNTAAVLTNSSDIVGYIVGYNTHMLISKQKESD